MCFWDPVSRAGVFRVDFYFFPTFVVDEPHSSYSEISLLFLEDVINGPDYSLKGQIFILRNGRTIALSETC